MATQQIRGNTQIIAATITNAEINAAAAIAATKIADGSVSNTEFQYLDGVTSAIQTQFTGKIDTSEKGANSGVATLDAGGKIPVSQLPNSVMEFQGVWNATTNSPSLADGTGSAGDVYRVGTAGTQDLGSGSQTFAVGDWVVYNGTIWQKSGNSTAVDSVNGYTGVITLVTDDIAEDGSPTNKYFTDARAKAATVADSITDGVTDVAPSQNAVFDALALKQTTTLSNGNILVGNGSSLAASVAMSGDVTISNTGVTTAAATLFRVADDIRNEIPSGTVNGSNVTFTLAYAPSDNAKVCLYVNGIRQKYSTHYSLSSTTLTFVTAPSTGDDIMVDYIK